MTDDESQYVATKKNTQIHSGAWNSKKKVGDIEMAEQEQLDETDNEPEPDASDRVYSGNDSDQLAAPGTTATSSTMEGNWPAFGANVAVTNNTARAANNIPGYSTTRLTTSSMG